MRDDAVTVANGQNGFLLCVGRNFIVHVDGDADAWWLLPAADADVATAAGAAVGAARVIKTVTEKRNQSEKRKKQFGPNWSLDYL